MWTLVHQTESWHYFAGDFEDNYRVSSKLTLSLGTRYECQAPRTDRLNAQGWFNMNVLNPIGPTVGLPNLKGGEQFSRVIGNSRYLSWPDLDNFGPRFGFAYQIKPKTVIRGGCGIRYLPNGRPNLASSPASTTAHGRFSLA